MRMNRLVASLIALVVMAASPLALAAPATAADKVKREIRAQGIEPKENKFFIKGKVLTGSYPKAKLVMMRKPGGAKKWSNWKTFKTDAKSSYRVRVNGPSKGAKKVCYKVKAPSSKKYKTSFSPKLCIVRTYY
ncbi:hypothetical protein [Nocardioides marmotae]|uniref:Uncharacterized protein n=1 Tax=Nocardioides marmotae TaxID=2663857 RepID=A0A6I3IT35_9ACTN|nr:hypothetical protein [Nocardioides marmotae]MCR6030052.1 hypothetical protein [Gordonia jinghuaiqii]MBC9733009.1 hypothetical protein [Nocardioides marmotae]MTB84123.1 hypothetical protein [Nocardioides marmotae]MTB93683.1 hypothetical protein [Nocardioides marmotae]QKE00030.1 hypothetical protein HPC71_02235 [Nocardioides marmotae]